jgi:LSD1 subclass zinc finger protein
MTAPRCGDCRAALVITRDAIGRPRYRCPVCQGVNMTPYPKGLQGNGHRQTALDSRALGWPPPLVPLTAHGRCRECGEDLTTGGRGRPREHCEDGAACRRRVQRRTQLERRAA